MCSSQLLRGRPGLRFHEWWGGRPSDASAWQHRAWLAATASGRRAMWENTERQCFATSEVGDGRRRVCTWSNLNLQTLTEAAAAAADNEWVIGCFIGLLQMLTKKQHGDGFPVSGNILSEYLCAAKVRVAQVNSAWPSLQGFVQCVPAKAGV